MTHKHIRYFTIAFVLGIIFASCWHVANSQTIRAATQWVVPPTTGGGGPPTLYADTVDADGRNAFTYSGTTYNGSGSDPLYCGSSGTGDTNQTAWQFKAGVPQGYIVDSAFVHFWIQNNNTITESGGETNEWYIYSYNVGAPAAWGNAVGTEIDAIEAITTEYVSWLPTVSDPVDFPDVDVVNVWVKSPDVKTIVQVPISRGDYSGTTSYIAVIMVPKIWLAGRACNVASFNVNPTHPAYINIYAHAP